MADIKTSNQNNKKKRKRKMHPVFKVWIIVLVASLVLGVASGAIIINNFKLGQTFDITLDSHEPGGIVNILLMGTDEGGSRCDTIMLVNLNGETGKLNVLSIPRDTAIVSRNSNGKVIYNSYGNPVYNKINSYMAIGQQQVAKGKLEIPEELVIQKVKEVTGLPIHYFATVDFDGFINIIDALGGVDFNVPENMNYDDPVQDLHIHLKKGQQHLDGKAAHDLVRYRSYNNGRADLARIETQQNFIKELVRQHLTVSNLGKVDDIYEIVYENTRTNYTLENVMSSFGTIKNLSPDKVNMYVLPNTPGYINGISYVFYNTDENMAERDKIFENFKPKKEDK